MSWYRTYRPRKVADLHLASVRTTLTQLLQQGWLPQTVLLAGPKGTGKTSTARILAALLNDPANSAQVEQIFTRHPNAKSAESKKTPAAKPLAEPDSSQELVQRIFSGNSLAVHELDAASNRGIDDIRQLKEQTVMPPAEGIVSVYILDEVHMLTTEAFNALLKVLEEPPAHVVFVLATTELHKLPATIVSRCTLLQFTTATVEELVAALTGIAEKEHVSFDAEGLALIAEKADGSFRDAVKLAEHIASQTGVLTATVVAQQLGEVQAPVHALVAAIVAKDSVAVVAAMTLLRSAQPDYRSALKSIVDYLYRQLQLGLGVTVGKPALVAKVSHYLLQAFSSLPATESSPVPLLSIELKALELVFKAQQKAGASTGGSTAENGSGHSGKVPAAVPTGAKTKSAAAARQTSELTDVIAASQVIDPVGESDAMLITASAPPEEVPSAGQPVGDPTQVLDKWPTVMEALKAKNATLAAILNSAKPLLNAKGGLEVEVYYKFHRDQIVQPKFQAMFQAAVREVTGSDVEVTWVVGEQLNTELAAGVAEETMTAVVSNLL